MKSSLPLSFRWAYSLGTVGNRVGEAVIIIIIIIIIFISAIKPYNLILKNKHQSNIRLHKDGYNTLS